MPFWTRKVPPTAELSDETLENYLALLRSKGWTIAATSGAVELIDEGFRRRYPRVPEQYLKFLSRVASCVNADETVWFLCAAEYNGTSDSEWAWNEFEKQDLEGAGDDQEWRTETTSFWDNNFRSLNPWGADTRTRVSGVRGR